MNFYTLRGGSSNAWASCSKWPLCEPSQNGLLADMPQRQRKTMVLPCNPYALPCISTISKSPSTFTEPLLFIVSFVMIFFREDSNHNREFIDKVYKIPFNTCQ